MYCGRPSPRSRRSCSLACAMSRATTSDPVRLSRVFTGCWARISSTRPMGWSRSTCTTSPSRSPALGSGRYFAGSVSSCSRKTPSSVIFPSAWRSAEQLTPRPMGHDAPCRGSRTNLTSWQKYFPPNCAPMPIFCVSWWIRRSISRSRNPRPSSFPEVWRLSRYLVLASLTVLRFISALRPPTTTARWYGGHAAVPSVWIFSSRKAISFSGVSTALVCWYRKVLFALPPPLAMN
mmetsp:Transcript_10709/g.30067  ORF Transcript_10709/g.30067 Transcript_10709/m.30067 type:complete len:234 (+) Transcript_10709:106-807(+)